MHFAAVQYDIAWEDKPANFALMSELIAGAALPRGSFVLLPELGDTGFSFNLDRIVDGQSEAWASATAHKFGVSVQAGFAQIGADGRGRNCAAIFDGSGRELGTYEKVHPFSYGREIEHFTGGGGLVLADVGVATVCPMICYDLRFPELWRLAALAGAEVFTIGASWPAKRQNHWRSLLVARAIENQAYVVAANRIGNDPHLTYAGGSMIIGPRGEVIAEGGSDNACVLCADLDMNSLRAWRKEFPALADIHRDLLGEIAVRRVEGSNSK